MNTRYKMLIAWFAIVLAACGSDPKSTMIEPGAAIFIDSLPGNCPYLTKDNSGNVVMSWARLVNDSTSVFCYAKSVDGGKTFGSITTIPSSDNMLPHAENLPKIIFKPSGEIIAIWGAAQLGAPNKYAGAVFYSQSFDEGISWTKSRPLVNDTSGYDQRYYDVALLPGGEAGILWLDNRKTDGSEGSALFYASTDGTDGFKNEKLISQGCCQCCRTDLFVDSKGTIHVIYRGIIQDSIRDMLHSLSTDNGNHFSTPQLISDDRWVIKGCPHTGPSMTENAEGLHFAWFTGGMNKGCYYSKSSDNGKSFKPREQISYAGGHPQITGLSSGETLTAWDENVAVNNINYRKIGVQKRSRSGKSDCTVFITADTLTATFPVIAGTDKNHGLVAYTLKQTGKNYVAFQQIRLN